MRPTCTSCGSPMKKNGKTSSGAQRWRCTRCGASYTHHIDSSAKQLDRFLGWLMTARTESDLTCSSATFRRSAQKFWKIWPLSTYTGEIYKEVFLDGIWVARNLVVLIACTKDYVIGWTAAQSESAAAWEGLLMRIAPPQMALSDGGGGVGKAIRCTWPTTRLQRCTYHAFCAVKRCTTSRPKLECGQELLALATELLRVKDVSGAARWMAPYAEWCARWEEMLAEYTFVEGRRQYVHERLRKARRQLNRLLEEHSLFCFVEMAEKYGGTWDSTTNVIEGGVCSQIRSMLRAHRGLSALKRMKAVFWWCYLHSEDPLSSAEILRVMPTDDDIEGLFARAAGPTPQHIGPERWGTGLVWNEFHTPTEWRD